MLLDRSLSFVTTFGWIALGVGLAIFFIRLFFREAGMNALRDLFTNRPFLALLASLVIITIISESIIFIEPTEVGVVISLTSPDGYRDRPLRSGLHWVIPLAEQVYRYPVYFQTYTMSGKVNEGTVVGDDAIAARTNDGQEVFVDCSVIFRIDPSQSIRLYIDWQDRYTEDFVRPLLRGLVRAEVAKYDAEEVNSSKRNDIEQALSQSILDALAAKGLLLDRFLLRNIAFSPEFAESIELKQVAEQEKLRREFEALQVAIAASGEFTATVTRANADAEAVRVRADAEAYALNQINSALAQNSNLLLYRYIDKLAPNVRVMLVPNNTPYILPYPDLTAGITDTTMPTGTAPITSSIGITLSPPITITEPPSVTLPITSSLPITP